MSILLNISIGSEAAGPALWVTILTSLGSAVIGGLVTLWFKLKEFKNVRENLNLQRDLFLETKQNNEHQIKAELVRLQNLRKEYELSMKKHEFAHLVKVLEFADDGNRKANMLKDLAVILNDFSPNPPGFVNDLYEYHEFVIAHIYPQLEKIRDSLIRLVSEHPHVFISHHQRILEVANHADEIHRNSYVYISHNAELELILHKLAKPILELNEELSGLLTPLKEEFTELESIKSQFIKSQVEKEP